MEETSRDAIADRFLTLVLLPYLDAQEEPAKVGLNELQALISGFNMAGGYRVSLIHLDVAIWRRLRRLEYEDEASGMSTKVLVHARRLSKLSLHSPTSVISPTSVSRPGT